MNTKKFDSCVTMLYDFNVQTIVRKWWADKGTYFSHLDTNKLFIKLIFQVCGHL